MVLELGYRLALMQSGVLVGSIFSTHKIPARNAEAMP